MRRGQSASKIVMEHGAGVRKRAPQRRAQASGVEEGSSKNRSGGDGRLVIVVLDRLRLEGKAFVEFGERDREADFRHVEHVVVLQDKDTPSILRADVD